MFGQRAKTRNLNRFRGRTELPPTAGLPLLVGDLMPPRQASLTQGLANWLALPTPILTCSGTAALVVALQTLSQQHPERTEIIIPAYTCPLVPLALHHCPHLTAVVCDIVPNGIDLEPTRLQQLCSSQTLAVIVTHLAGQVANVAATLAITQPLGIAVIEDAAQAMGARDAHGNSVGLAGDVGFFSLAAGKGLTTFEGGVLFAKMPALHQAMALQAQSTLAPSWRWMLLRRIQLWGYALFYHPKRLWWVYGKSLCADVQQARLTQAVGDDFGVNDLPLHRLDDYRARIAAQALSRLPDYLIQGQKQAQKNVAKLASLPHLTLIQGTEHATAVWPFIMLTVPNQAIRDRILKRLWCAGVGVTRLFVYDLARYPNVQKQIKIATPYACPNAQALADTSFSISNSHWLDAAAFEWLYAIIKAELPPAPHAAPPTADD